MVVKIEKKRDRLTNKIVYSFICRSDGKQKLTYIIPPKMNSSQLKFLHNFLKNCAEFQEFKKNCEYEMQKKGINY